MRKLISSGSPYEDKIGFSRAVKVGDRIVVSGTGPIASDGSTASPGDAYGQARRCLQIIEQAIKDAGGSMKNVIRTRIYLSDVSKWEEVGKAHGEYFKETKPASTMIEVKGFIRPEWLVEIEAECQLDNDQSKNS